MPETIGALLEGRAGAIAGRQAELALLRRLLERDGPVVAHVHGLAGVGKTTLVQAFAAEARAAGAVTIEVHGHTCYATQGAVLAAIAGSIDSGW
jgi:putative protein kinase ArgK-like GTPase of G3E family